MLFPFISFYFLLFPYFVTKNLNKHNYQFNNMDKLYMESILANLKAKPQAQKGKK